jgi:hypothetical protein
MSSQGRNTLMRVSENGAVSGRFNEVNSIARAKVRRVHALFLSRQQMWN